MVVLALVAPALAPAGDRIGAQVAFFTGPAPPIARADAATLGPQGILNLDHLIFIVQENRSFDHYFGSCPRALGLRFVNGRPTNCVPDPVLGHDFDAYLKLIEDRFLGGQRLDPATDGRPDSRPVVRETLPILGDLALVFNFEREPRPPLVLDPTP
ncbi:MAG: hypothetical protein L0206_19965 [Actinobacteria bacterium]|nr:hypothetical protein [Actinomycetota bacterium]